jgi:putative ABC transport system permease protein
VKNLWRHRTRTALTVSGSAVALFLFSVVGSVQDGLARLTRDRHNERSLIVFQANRFCPFTSRLPEDYARKIRKVPGVAEVAPIQLFMNNCRASLDLIVFYGFRVDQLRQLRNIEVTHGSWSDFASRRDGALVGRSLARRRGLDVGSRFTVGDVTVTVAGVFRSPEPAEEHFLYCHLEFLQRRGSRDESGRKRDDYGLVTQFEVQLEPSADAPTVCRAIDETLRGGQVQTDTRTKGAFQANAVGDLIDLIHFANYLGYACVGLVLMLVGTTTVMAVQDRTREHAVLQTLGFPWRRIFGLVLTESLIVSLLGGGLGVMLAHAGLSWSGLAVGTEGVSIPFEPSLGLVLTGLVISLGVGLLAGLVPAWQAARAEIVVSLRYV